MDIGLLPQGRSIFESKQVYRRTRAEQAETYTKMQAKDELFTQLELAPDGGLQFEAGQLYTPMRILPAIVACVGICLNIYSLGTENYKFLTAIHDDNVIDRLNLTEIIAARWGFSNRYMAEKLVASFEILTVVYLLISMCGTIIQMFYGKSDFVRWSATARLFLSNLPELKYFSAMRLLQHILPYVIVQEGQAMMWDFQDRRSKGEKRRRMVLEAMVFVAIRLIVFVFGFDAFIVKFRAATMASSNVSFMSFVKIAVFLNQTVGIVQIERITMQRVMLFIFGGEDSVVSGGESRLMQAYLARLFEKIWTAPSTSRPKALAVSLTFADRDFQSLMLNEYKREVVNGEF